MNIKQKMIAAAREAGLVWVYENLDKDADPVEDMLDAALSVLADPANWTDELETVIAIAKHEYDPGECGDPYIDGVGFGAVINHVKGLPS